ncbi:MAG: hypothetical protein A2Z24_01445 [Candidatus Woykebacteria bacterium RBG_16_44_10]|uniref:Peptidase A2 domain-containing protein n=1 Tax=Candidatus Woykebacteria bacterium RBG_16_44_10 TaxID=1802597 RepID=A0A1G1WF06_9BACT|nr:MAG: hypothetical protein A2Z24_01445 [Candidatus Woykebacteria bacterium RBG_16_44_10]
MIRIPYTKLPSVSQKEVYLPLVKVRLGYKKTHKITPTLIVALVDSGADVCFCSEQIGAWLGIQFTKIKKETTFTAANSTPFTTKPEVLRLYAYGEDYDCKFYFTDVLPRHTPIILGQLGFFDHFKILFDFKNKVIELG